MAKNTLPLHKTTHFRRLREVICELTNKAKVDVTKYDLQNIKCYRSTGKNLMGKNVLTLKAQRDRCCFVKDNDYEIYECPCTTNTKSDIGEFLMIAHNIDFDYWLVIIFEYCLSTKNNKSYVNVKYDPKYNGYVMYKNKENIVVQEFNHEFALQLGANINNVYFDNELSRSNAYNITIQQHSINNTEHQNTKLATNEQVAVFKKKRQ